MAIKMDTQDVSLPVAPAAYRRRVEERRRAEPMPSNQRRVVTGVVVSLGVLVGAVIWQYFDDQAAFPAVESDPVEGGTDAGAPVIGSIALDPDPANP